MKLIALLIFSTGVIASCPDPQNGRGIENGIQLVKHFEGFYNTAYWDVDAWAVGYGSRGPGIGPKTRWDEERADRWLRVEFQDVRNMICDLITVELNTNQIDALTSLTYNIGIGRLMRSGIIQLINEDKFAVAARKFLKYNKAEGVVLKGLTRRRQVEINLFTQPEI